MPYFPIFVYWAINFTYRTGIMHTLLNFRDELKVRTLHLKMFILNSLVQLLGVPIDEMFLTSQHVCTYLSVK